MVLVVLLGPLPARAETTQSDLVLIREDDVVTEDLYAAGNTVQIAGRIEGDLVASAFGELRIDGTVEGDVTVIASRVVIAGVVDGSVRVTAPEVVIEGTIGEDLVVAGRVVTIARSASIGRDVVVAAWRLDHDGRQGRDIEGFIRNATLGGEIAENVEIDVRSLTVTDTARIGGDLAYRSSREAVIADSAEVSGSVLARTPLPPNVRVSGLALLLRVLLVVFGAALGLSMVWAATARAAESAAALKIRTRAVVGQGVAVAALPVFLIGGGVGISSFMSPEAALPLLAVAIPFALGLLGLLVLAAMVAPVPPAIFIGSRLRPSGSVYARYLLGFLAIAVVSALPYVGRFVLLAVIVIGIGAWLTRAEQQES
ncbi:MAG: polymer-forming cytoskeletal protein [Acidimicrobiia bacterium]